MYQFMIFIRGLYMDKPSMDTQVQTFLHKIHHVNSIDTISFIQFLTLNLIKFEMNWLKNSFASRTII